MQASNPSASANAARYLAQCASYCTPEGLLDDLRGQGGETRRFLASGYAMAIHELDAPPLSGSDLLAHLEGRNGEDMRLVGIGFVACVRDTLASREAGSSQVRERTVCRSESDINRVVRWLQSHPRLGAEGATRAVRSALADEFAPGRISFTGRVRIRSAMGWCAATGGALAIAALVAVHPWRTGKDAVFTRDFHLSQEASVIQALILEERRYEKDTFLNIADRAQIVSYARKWDHSRVSLEQTLARARKLVVTEQDREVLQKIDEDFTVYVNGFERVLSKIRAGQVSSAEEANAQFTVYKDAVHRIESNSEALGDRAMRRLNTTA